MFYFYRLNWNSKCEGVVKECKNVLHLTLLSTHWSHVICLGFEKDYQLSMANVCGSVIFKQITGVEWFTYTLVPLWRSVRRTNMLHVFNISSCPSLHQDPYYQVSMFSLHLPVFCFARGPGPGQYCKHRVGGMSQPLPPPPPSDCLNCLKRAIVILIIDIPRGLARVVSVPAPARTSRTPRSHMR